MILTPYHAHCVGMDRYDAKVFAASAVLSSLLIYNTLGGVINSQALEYLDLLGG